MSNDGAVMWGKGKVSRGVIWPDVQTDLTLHSGNRHLPLHSMCVYIYLVVKVNNYIYIIFLLLCKCKIEMKSNYLACSLSCCCFLQFSFYPSIYPSKQTINFQHFKVWVRYPPKHIKSTGMNWSSLECHCCARAQTKPQTISFVLTACAVKIRSS